MTRKRKGRKDWDPREEVQRFAEEKVRGESAQEFAREAVRRPRDFAYWGELPIGETWGYVITRSRDANLLEESNYETIKADLEERFPDDVQEERASHWAVGWVDQLAVRMLDDQGVATRAADAVYEWMHALKNYPVADDEDLSRREYEDTIENIKSESGVDDDVASEVFSWFWAHDQSEVEPRDGRGGYPSRDAIEKVLWAIGKPTEEMVEEKREAEEEEWEQMTPEEREAKRRREFVDPPEQQRLFGRKSWDPRTPKRKRFKAPYDPDLPSMPPFMWVERHERLGSLGVIAFGAYNAMGLIGSEKGGVAVVHEDPPAVLATRDIPWEPAKRDREVDDVVALIRNLDGYDEIPADRRRDFLEALRDRGYDMRGDI